MTKPKADLLQGTPDLLILKALSLGRSTATASSGAFGSCLKSCLMSSKDLSTRRSTGPGQRGRISSKWGAPETGRRAKFYTLTEAGNKQLKAEEENWDRLALAVAKVRKAV